MMPELNSRPHLALGCRLNEKGQQSRVLHMPERALRLNGPSLEIVERCRFSLEELAYQYPEEQSNPSLTPQQTLEKLTWEGAALGSFATAPAARQLESAQMTILHSLADKSCLVGHN